MTARINGMDYLSCREGSAAMALVTAAREPKHMFTAFTAGSFPSRWSGLGSGLTQLAISPRQRLDDVVRQIGALQVGGTDCALPMLEAAKHRWPIDLFGIYPDCETWTGQVHPAQAVRQYRQRMGMPAQDGRGRNGVERLHDRGSGRCGKLDVVGFDTVTPNLIADFATAI